MASNSSVLILCEEGWQNFRNLSLALAEKGIQTAVLIKGDPGGEVRAFISRRPRVKNYFVPRLLFRITLPFFLVWLARVENCRVCVWSRERTRDFIAAICTLFDMQLVRMVEEGSKYHLENAAGQEISEAGVLQLCELEK